MDVRAGSATLAKINTSTLAAPARNSARTAVDGCPRRQHVIDENQAAAGHGGLAVTGHTKRALDIGGAFGPRQPNLLRGRLDSLKCAGSDRHTGLTRYCRGQHGGLIETPRP